MRRASVRPCVRKQSRTVSLSICCHRVRRYSTVPYILGTALYGTCTALHVDTGALIVGRNAFGIRAGFIRDSFVIRSGCLPSCCLTIADEYSLLLVPYGARTVYPSPPWRGGALRVRLIVGRGAFLNSCGIRSRIVRDACLPAACLPACM